MGIIMTEAVTSRSHRRGSPLRAIPPRHVRPAPRTHPRIRRAVPGRSPIVIERRGVWDRMQDDRELVRFKIVLLASLVLLTAIAEWVA